ncbi:hypothetical protein DM02DRAFT_102867 [Periconia macrospinosa]|uniref:DUF7580 domain-containing protein n=1 Tax=Periconia macrospinosa TaxID=97972 RepID=A0A2V1DFG5_9PLEO|nr:hypothetical protein DM02DRAFT_102867 [Periconia macrospinosa]
MSGLEVAGVVLGAFPLIVSGVEHWRDVAKVGGFYWRIQKEYTKCKRDIQYQETMYKHNLKELLLPILHDKDEVARLVSDPGGKRWTDKTLQERLRGRLQESYSLYMEIIDGMNETAEFLRKELALDKIVVQNKLAPPVPNNQKRPASPQRPSKPSRNASTKDLWDWEKFRVKFSFNDPIRNELFSQLNECNERLTRLLSSSDKLSALQKTTAPAHTKQSSALETALRKACEKSALLFKALQNAWRCSCQQYHFANLRLEHRTIPDICFEVILMFVTPSTQISTPWSWRALQCGHMKDCSFPPKHMKLPVRNQPSQCPVPGEPASSSQSIKQKKVAFASPALSVPRIELDILDDPRLNLCQRLGDKQCGDCMGVIGHDGETYHLHPSDNNKRPSPHDTITLDHVLSDSFEGYVSRRERYVIALLIASSVAQLQSTPWLRTGLTKDDVLFYRRNDDDREISYHEPFIRQGFHTNATSEVNEFNFYSLGILLLELCFGKRLEDHPLRKKYVHQDTDTKQAFDVMAALKWSQSVSGEAGDDYALAVKWCFTEGTLKGQNWRGEVVKNVIRPLEMCQEHFNKTSVF